MDLSFFLFALLGIGASAIGGYLYYRAVVWNNDREIREMKRNMREKRE